MLSVAFKMQEVQFLLDVFSVESMASVADHL